MAKKKVEKNNTINIKSQPVQAHIGAARFANDDWGTIAFSFPRTDLSLKFIDKELRYNSIYFLFGYEGGHEVAYVGQALKRSNGESALARLREHDKSTTEPYRDKWSWVIVVTNKDDTWGATELNALESIFIQEVPEKNNLNGRGQNNGGADISLYEDKVTQIKALITAIGFKIFEDIPEKENIQVISEVNEYSIVEDLQNGMARIPEIVTPDKVVKAMVDMLPAEVWNRKTKFLDPACKGGEYLREIYDRLMENETMQSDFENPIERSTHILKNQIYGIALSQVSLDRTTKKLFGEDRNIKIIPDYINKLKGINMGSRPDGKQNNIGDILNKEFGKDMEFDVVIGNPPYQEYSGTRSVAIFDKFIKLGMEHGKYSCMITPARWLTDSKYEKFREAYLHNVKKVYIHKECKNVFNGINCGAVSYYLADDGQGIHNIQVKLVDDNMETNISSDAEFIPVDKYAVSILSKCKNQDNKTVFKFLGRRIFGRSPRWSDGAPLLVLDDNGDMNFITYENAMFITNKCNSSDISNREYADSYRLITGSILNMSQSVIGELGVTVPNTASDFNIATLYYSKDKDECYVCSKYIKTKFARYLILITLSKSQTSISEDRLKYIPYQDFTSDSDIDWSQSISNIDQQLYKKYNLSDEEIAYIESTIKPME